LPPDEEICATRRGREERGTTILARGKKEEEKPVRF
jgi:hypothetical protein